MRVLPGLLAATIAATALACDGILGIHDHDLAPVTAGSDGGTSGPSDASGASDGGPSGACATGSLTCNDNTPEVCDGGAWHAEPACGGTTPVCSNGKCGTFRTTGGLRSTAPVPAVDAGIFLVAGGFELGARNCTDAGVCVTGGIVP